LSTTKFHNSSIPTTFILVIFSSEVVFKIQILFFLNSDIVFVIFYREFFTWHSAKSSLLSAQKKHSAKNLALSKEPNSGN
jgi:hypothetical protein